jgi:3-oxoadipate enol-lactonase
MDWTATGRVPNFDAGNPAPSPFTEFSKLCGAAMQNLTISSNGIRMNVVAAGAGRPVVFLHGIGWDHEMWLPLQQELSARYRVIVGDHRGHGRSDKPPGPYEIEQFADDWYGVLKQLEVENACIIGFSLGGKIAQAFVTKYPEMVSALMLACTTGRPNADSKVNTEKRISETLAKGGVAAAQWAAKIIFAPQYAAAEPKKIEEFIQWRGAMDQNALVETARAGTRFDVVDRLKAIKAPAQVVLGEADMLTKPDAVEALWAAMPAGTDLIRVPGAGHMLPVEQPQRFKEIVSSFLDRHYPAG